MAMNSSEDGRNGVRKNTESFLLSSTMESNTIVSDPTRPHIIPELSHSLPERLQKFASLSRKFVEYSLPPPEFDDPGPSDQRCTLELREMLVDAGSGNALVPQEGPPEAVTESRPFRERLHHLQLGLPNLKWLNREILSSDEMFGRPRHSCHCPGILEARPRYHADYSVPAHEQSLFLRPSQRCHHRSGRRFCKD